MAYDPWGKRRFTNGTADLNDSIVGLTTDRGYTEHEELDELGIIHMNGRIYDPYIGRFMSADPYIQALYELQSHNRYAYVMNNPLLYTDPSGYSWLGSLWKDLTGSSWVSFRDNVVKPVIIIAIAYYTGQWGLAQGWGAIGAGAFAGGVSGAIGAAINGQDPIRGALVGAFSGAAFGWAGGVGGDGLVGANSTARYLAHAAAGCASSLASGGGASGCGRGAASAVIGKWVTNNSNFGLVGNGIAATVSGGVTSLVMGGSFANGATTAAYGYLFNCVQTKCYELKPSNTSRLSLYGTPEGSHFGRQSTIDTILLIDEIWRLGGNGQSIEVGNISTENRGHPDHESHKDGEDVDIRPIRTGHGRQNSGSGPLTFGSPNYDREGTQRLINIILFVAPASTIYFNDPNIQGAQYYRGHNNHIHVRFKW
jgi:RHS repeat-associated protein